ncbi:MAG: phosphoadenosine phosphosulfate reductase family protein [Agrobacterium cavarae]
MSRLLVSFSGGETSALMTRLIHERWHNRYSEIVTVFANTGLENEETLEFVRQCDDAFGWAVVWVEAITYPERGKGVSARVVDFNTACRDGSVFEAMIAKYGIPGPGFFHCSRELKERVITAYCRSIGWKSGTYDTAIGIRNDEVDRITPSAKKKRLLYPLASEWPVRKPDVNAYWDRHPFRLRLKGYRGNCKTCWKKSLRKHLTIMSETPGDYDFFERMEATYPMSGSNPNNEPKRFFRNRLTVSDIRRLAADGNFEPAEDDAAVYQTDMFAGLELDVGGGCEESCEVTFDEDDAPTHDNLSTPALQPAQGPLFMPIEGTPA